jgi:hypothetical protein
MGFAMEKGEEETAISEYHLVCTHIGCKYAKLKGHPNEKVGIGNVISLRASIRPKLRTSNQCCGSRPF